MRMFKLQQYEIEDLDGDDAENLSFFNDDIRNKVADLKEALGRFESQLMGLRRLNRSVEQAPSPKAPYGIGIKIKRLRRAA